MADAAEGTAAASTRFSRFSAVAMPMLELSLLVLIAATVASLVGDAIGYAVKLIGTLVRRRAPRRRTLPPVDWAAQADVPVQLRGLSRQTPSKADEALGDLAPLHQRIDGA